MKNLLATLQRTNTLLILFAMTVVMTLAFGVVMYLGDFHIIDEMYHAPTILSHIEAMTAQQKSIHIWMTATLDVAYPFVYGALLVGITLRTFDKYTGWLIVPCVAVIPVDLLEGVVQVLLLSGNEQVAGFKTVLTPLKLTLLCIGLVICAAGLARTFIGKSKLS